MSSLSGAACQAVLLLSRLGRQQELRAAASQPHQREAVSPCKAADPRRQELRAQQEQGLSLLPDTSFRNSQAFAFVPVMV